ncbi:ankyrin [Piromyces finnis]|uniref:Ankyrin n=1 Tax=Piromyces finnis TaxID=1754191 RepID=A0A1Y1VLY7_9FUNG|nr:ankyrin [Piromyces finnis]|eukprot:ORX59928.1 ankyrin [Piromyces finnis]
MDNYQSRKKEIIKLLNECGDNIKIFNEHINNHDIELKEFKKNEDFDILIYSIEQGQTPEMVEYIIRNGEYNNVNYTIIAKKDSDFIYKKKFKVPLFEAIACENFKAADLLLSYGANINYLCNSNQNIGDYLNISKCINKRTMIYLNKNSCLKYLNTEKMLFKWISNSNYIELKTLFECIVNNNSYILNFLNLYKNRTCLTYYQLQRLIIDQKKKIKITDIVYKKAVEMTNRSNLGIIKLLFYYDGNSNEILYDRLIKNNLLHHAMINRGEEIIWRILYCEFLNSKSKIFEETLNYKNLYFLEDLGRQAIKCFIDQLFKHPKRNNFNLNISIISQEDLQYLILILNMAININNFKLIKFLIENTKLKSANINTPDRNNDYPIFVALENTTRNNDNINIFKYILSLIPQINIKNCYGNSLLSVALLDYKYKAASILLKYKESIELDMQENYSPLIKAIYRNELSTVKSILSSNNSNWNVIRSQNKKICINNNNNRFSPITLAYLLDRKDIFLYLYNHLKSNDKKENNKYILDVDFYGYYIIYYAILKEDLETFNLLLDYYAFKEFKPNYLERTHSMIEIIISVGNKDIFFAVDQKNIEMNDKNKSKPAFYMEKTNMYDETPLISLLKLDESSLEDKSFKMSSIIDNDPEIINRVESESSPIYRAIEMNSLPIIKYLISRGLSISGESNIFSYLFINSLKSSDMEVIRFLASCKPRIDFNLETHQSKIFRMLSLRNDNKEGEILEFILDNDMLNIKNIISFVIRGLIKNNNEKLLNILFSKGFDVNRVYDDDNDNLLTYSIDYDNENMVNFLTKKGINYGLLLNTSDPMKYIEYIISHNKISSLKYLIEQCHLDTNFPNNQRNNLLILAIKHKKLNIIQYLIDCGIAINDDDITGEYLYGLNKFYNYQYRFYFEKINKLLDKVKRRIE